MVCGQDSGSLELHFFSSNPFLPQFGFCTPDSRVLIHVLGQIISQKWEEKHSKLCWYFGTTAVQNDFMWVVPLIFFCCSFMDKIEVHYDLLLAHVSYTGSTDCFELEDSNVGFPDKVLSCRCQRVKWLSNMENLLAKTGGLWESIISETWR